MVFAIHQPSQIPFLLLPTAWPRRSNETEATEATRNRAIDMYTLHCGGGISPTIEKEEGPWCEPDHSQMFIIIARLGCGQTP